MYSFLNFKTDLLFFKTIFPKTANFKALLVLILDYRIAFPINILKLSTFKTNMHSAHFFVVPEGGRINETSLYRVLILHNLTPYSERAVLYMYHFRRCEYVRPHRFII